MRVRRLFRLFVWLPGALLALTLLPATSGATVLAPWGSNLQATPSLDTANGASAANRDLPQPGDNGILPNPHDGADTAIWNNQLASGSPSAAQAGQVLQIKVKGCAVKDTTVGPEDPNGNGTGANGVQYSAGIQANMIHFQTLTPQSGGSWKVDQTSQAFFFPFCGDIANGQSVTASTVTTFQPLHMCVQAGENVDFNDIGGFIPNPTGPSWYPQGVPYRILAPTSSSHMNSYIKGDGTNSGATFSPTDTGATNGWGSEPNEELLLQVVEGVGDDAYGQCGGQANESSNSNAVICVYHHTTPSDPYGTCNSSGQPVRPSVNQTAPGISSPSGAYQESQRLNAVRGTWSTDPNQTYETYAYQWEDCNASGGSCSAIQNATNSWYYPTASDVGHTLRVEESASNDAGTQGPISSAPTPLVAGPNAPVITNLKLNPSSFFSSAGSTITYADSKGGTATLRVINAKGALVKSLTRSDHAGDNGVGGALSRLAPGRYTLQVSSTYAGVTGATVTAPFTVKAPVAKKASHKKPRKKPSHKRKRRAKLKKTRRR